MAYGLRNGSSQAPAARDKALASPLRPWELEAQIADNLKYEVSYLNQSWKDCGTRVNELLRGVGTGYACGGGPL